MKEQCYYADASSKIINLDASSSVKIYKNAYITNCKFDDNVSIGDFSRVSNSNLAENVIIQRNNMIFSANIGRFTYTGKNFTAWHCDIGKFCSISWNVSIGGANHDYSRVTTHSFLYSNDFHLMGENEGYNRFNNKCEIGNDVWIAANACICRNVKIGNGAVIAAGAVVTKDVEPYTIVAGVPARPINKRFSQEIIDILQKSQWWDLPKEVIKENFDLFNSHPTVDIANKILKLKKFNTQE